MTLSICNIGRVYAYNSETHFEAFWLQLLETSLVICHLLGKASTIHCRSNLATCSVKSFPVVL